MLKDNSLKLPFYIRLTYILLSTTLVLAILYVGQRIIIPIVLALLFAILLRPVVHFLNKKLKFPHVIAVLFSVILFILFIGGIIFFVSWKIGDVANDLSQIRNNLSIHYHHLRYWIKETFHLSYIEQEKYIRLVKKDSWDRGNELMGNTLSTFTGTLLDMVLIPLYIFLFLLYRNIFIKFLSKLFKEKHQVKVEDVLLHVKIAIHGFLVGLLIEMALVATLTSIGLMIAGVQYAILLGVITGILNLIPYIGIIVATLLSIFATLTSSTDISVIAGVIIVNVIVHLSDANILVPMIISSKVKINAFVSIIGVITGGTIAGIAGTFLAIPIIAILKVISDRIESLEPWGFLMGDDLPKTYEWGKLTLPSLEAGDPSHLETVKTSAIEKNADSEKNNSEQ